MTLDQWRNTKGLTDAELGRLLGMSGVNAGRIRNGQRRPRGDVMQRIIDATDGAVTPNDMHQTWLAAQREAAE